MTITQELSSWFSPSHIEIAPALKIGDKAPSCPELAFPTESRKPTIITFLRHCGCPVSEVAFLTMRKAAAEHLDINFVAISHSNQQSTDKWLEAVGGPKEGTSSESVTVIVDAERNIYAKWGLGTVSWGHLFSPGGLLAVYKMGKDQGVWNRPTESGSRWQSSGNWAVDGEGYVRWGGPATRVDEVVDIAEVMDALKST
ncbi:hypothetical protein N7478_009651 [Penicillium angulare]|uniref:uncharacterized protein n=1 Tax=Penicillium angulare TaxID=116970 RepID=UPI00254111C3|nr:uncharacterized protein N7478_009651 [Penicillium angulare]KAJ5266843.1 hypothetical protein N7478_009651 [Penicillium angulare]